MTFGGHPYSGIEKSDQMKAALKNGHVLIKPQLASDILYELMKKCWNLAHRDRPTFVQCLNALQNMTNEFFSSSLNELAELVRNISQPGTSSEDEAAMEPTVADVVEITRV